MKPGRNDPCPCGSGKKYKHCCSNLSLAGGPSSARNAGRVADIASAPTASEQNQLIALYQSGRYAELEHQAGLLVRRHPGSGFGWKILSAALSSQGKDALHAYQRAAELLPQDAKVLNNLGDLLAKRGRHEEAAVRFGQAISLQADYADALQNLGVTLVQLNRVAEAEACFRKVLETNKDCVEARYFLAQSKKVQPDDENHKALVEIGQRVANKTLALSEPDLLHLNFALGKGYDDMACTDQAFSHFAEGAKLKRRSLQYDSHVESHNVDELIRIFDEARLAGLRGGGNPSETPVFIVGMPRSGTTLTEHIIASHPAVYGAGELPDMHTIARRGISGVIYPGSLRLLNRERLGQWADEYLTALTAHSPDSRRITDKLPANYMLIGLIHLMFPNAKIIHVNRNPVDTCFSCFTNLFANDHVPWSYDFDELGAYYVGYARLMAHWRKVLPKEAFLDVYYEDIVQNREAEAKRMIEYCGLEWNDACLESHKQARPVRTASFLQVRRPVYTSSVERWRRYEKHLGPLLDVLGDLAPTSSDSGIAR